MWYTLKGPYHTLFFPRDRFFFAPKHNFDCFYGHILLSPRPSKCINIFCCCCTLNASICNYPLHMGKASLTTLSDTLPQCENSGHPKVITDEYTWMIVFSDVRKFRMGHFRSLVLIEGLFGQGR